MDKISELPDALLLKIMSLLPTAKDVVTLKLSNAVLVDDVTCHISFPSLEKLSLESIKYRRG
ncbi:unnamed protein product [Arabidopsis halleri]